MAENNEPANKKRKVENDEIKNVCDLLSIRVGKLNIGKNQKITLLLNDNIKIDLMNITKDEYVHLDKTYFSKNAENIFNKSCCKYKKTKNFDIDLDVKSILKTINVEGYIHHYTLNYYKAGDFKVPHYHGSRKGLIGTLVLLLPSKNVGGDFCFGDYCVEKDMDKSSLRFIYFNKTMEPSVTKVSSGNLLSLVYYVYEPNYEQKKVIKFDKTVIHFPEEYYKKLLDYTINYCKGKKNILLGHYEHRDAAFNKRLRKDIKAKYEMIKVAAHIKSPLLHIETVYELKDDLYEDDTFSVMERGGREKKFSDLVDKEFEVQHKLLTEHCTLKHQKINLTIEDKYKRWSIDREYSVEFYTAYLINPADW